MTEEIHTTQLETTHQQQVKMEGKQKDAYKKSGRTILIYTSGAADDGGINLLLRNM